MRAKITAEHLERTALVYVRQSTPGQVRDHPESRRRQYALADVARDLGFRRVETIDDDLGISGSGFAERPGFQRLLTMVCSGTAGAVLALEASRLARNDRDWSQLVELGAITKIVLVDHDGVYDPRLVNDRLLLGLIMSDFEMATLRQRALEAQRAKAQRGELWMHLPVGLGYGPTGAIELDPDLRVQQAIRLVLQKFGELGSTRLTVCVIMAPRRAAHSESLARRSASTQQRIELNYPSSSMHFHHGLYEVHLPVTDVDRAIDFYVGKLGFEYGFGERGGPSALLLYTDGNTRWMLGLFRVDAVVHRQAAEYHISFRVAEEDVDRMVPYLRERGIEPVHPPRAPVQGPMHEPIVHGWMPAAAVFFKDPDGHLLELIAELADIPRPEVLYRPFSEWRTLVGKAPR